MNYEETLKYINNTPKFSKILGNADLLRLLDKLGNPQNRLRFIHVAGTNGKGSTCAMIASVLEKSGLKTGLFTSPFIEVFNERIRINGENIPDGELAEIATSVKNAIDEMKIEISVFAQITAVAFLYFSRQNCDIVVLETGMGGRLDATNTIPAPEVCIITKIGLDHTEYLGGSIAEIAAEKCGIIKSGTVAVTCANQPEEAMAVIKSACAEKNVRLITAPPYSRPLSLHGDFQKYNAGTAYAACRLLNIPEETIRFGLEHTEWAARFEYLLPNLILDGAHNPDGIDALVQTLVRLGQPIIFVTAMMRDKARHKSAEIINRAAQRVIATEIPMPRCLPAHELAAEFTRCETEPNCINAVRKALAYADGSAVVCVCGSLYLAGEIRKNRKLFTLPPKYDIIK